MSAENGISLEYKDLTKESFTKVMEKVRRLIALEELRLDTLHELAASLANQYGEDVIIERDRYRLAKKGLSHISFSSDGRVEDKVALCERCKKPFGYNGNEKAKHHEGRFWHVYDCSK